MTQLFSLRQPRAQWLPGRTGPPKVLASDAVRACGVVLAMGCRGIPYRFRMAAQTVTWGDAPRTDRAPSDLVLVRMLCLIATRIFAWLVLLSRASAAKEAEIRQKAETHHPRPRTPTRQHPTMPHPPPSGEEDPNAQEKQDHSGP